MAKNNLSVYLSYLLRHNPDDAGLHMDVHGWVSVQELIDGINARGKYTISRAVLEEIVAKDEKGRYRFSNDGKRVKACQGHSLAWIELELAWCEPPEYLYHGTTADALNEILKSGAISKMSRHAVHMQEDMSKAWKSAQRWHRTPVLLKIDAKRMHQDGMRFGVSENDVWCAESVPTMYICDVIRNL